MKKPGLVFFSYIITAAVIFAFVFVNLSKLSERSYEKQIPNNTDIFLEQGINTVDDDMLGIRFDTDLKINCEDMIWEAWAIKGSDNIKQTFPEIKAYVYDEGKLSSGDHIYTGLTGIDIYKRDNLKRPDARFLYRFAFRTECP